MVQKNVLNAFILILFSLFSIKNSMADDKIAVVLAVSGKASAGSRNLVRKSPIYQGDTIITAAKSKISFKFTDGAMVSLAENSSYQIKKYVFNSGKKANSFQARLLKGGLKTVTGKIGTEAAHSKEAEEAGIPKEQQVKPADYKFEAGVATIGVRGTDFATAIRNNEGSFLGLSSFFAQDDELKNQSEVVYCSVYDGTTEVNALGEQMLVGDEGATSYVVITDSGISSSYTDQLASMDTDPDEGDDDSADDDSGGDDSADDDSGGDDSADDDSGGDDSADDDSGGDDSADDDSGDEDSGDEDSGSVTGGGEDDDGSE